MDPFDRWNPQNFLDDDDDLTRIYDLLAQLHQPWRKQAACRGLDPNLFFPERGEAQKEVKKVCAACPVKAECLDFALDGNERFGIYGGFSERQRRKMRATRRAGGSVSASVHGTDGGYMAHLRTWKTPTCDACRAAHATACREWAAKSTGTAPRDPQDGCDGIAI